MVAEKSLRNLYAKGFGDLCIETRGPGRLLTPLSSSEAKKALTFGKVLVWNSEKKMWDWDVQQNSEWVVVTLTEKGKEALAR